MTDISQNEVSVSKGFNFRKCCILCILSLMMPICCCPIPIVVVTIVLLNSINELAYTNDNSTIYNDLNKTHTYYNYSSNVGNNVPTKYPSYLDFEPYNEFEAEISP